MTNGSEWALTVDLMTGEVYELEDILEINKEFIKEWDKSYCGEAGEELSDDGTLDVWREL